MVSALHGLPLREALLGPAALLYAVPVLALLVDALTGGAIAGGWGIDESSGAMLTGLAGLVIEVARGGIFERTEFARLRLVPNIIGIVESGSKEGSRAGTAPAPRESNRTCCNQIEQP